MSNAKMSRRGFVAGAGAALASASLAGVAFADEAPEQVWDQECEVLVCGYGAAGAACAIEAADNGAQVLIIEKAALPGGSMARCGGAIMGAGTKVQEALPYLERIDMLLVMTVEPGFGGQKYIETSTRKIREARAMLNSLNLDTDIEVDGGIVRENVDVVLNAGANVIVAGSAIYRGEIEENTEYFMNHFRQRPEGCKELEKEG